jgi:ribosomal protein S14
MASWSSRLGVSIYFMLSLKIKDLKNRNTFHFLEKSKIVDKFIFINALSNNSILSKRTVYFFCKKFKQLKSISKVKITRRCVLNNRNRGVLRPLGVSRVYLRELMQFGLVPGYSKAIW